MTGTSYSRPRGGEIWEKARQTGGERDCLSSPVLPLLKLMFREQRPSLQVRSDDNELNAVLCGGTD